MSETDDAMTLVSQARHPIELAYAQYANDMKTLANQARMEVESTGKIAYNANAKRVYENEVKSLNDKLNTAELNRGKERSAQRLANAEVNAKIKSNPDMDKGDIKKASQRALTKYRNEVGSVSRSERNINITEREWEAIQAGAISESQLRKILNNSDTARVRELATPRTKATPSSAQVSRIKALASSNYTLAEIAAKTGFSTSTVSKYLKGVK